MTNEASEQQKEEPKIAGWPLDGQGHVLITLQHPIKLKYDYPKNSSILESPRTLSVLRVRRIKVADLVEANSHRDDYLRGMFIGQRICGLADDDFEKLDAVDAISLMEVAALLQKKSA